VYYQFSVFAVSVPGMMSKEGCLSVTFFNSRKFSI